jgi:hypothetical protein
VFLTVAGAGGDIPDATLIGALVGACRAGGDPDVPLQVVAYHPVPFRLALQLSVDPAAVFADVAVAVEAALRKAFGFAARDLGQAVTLSEIYAVVQAVPSVIGSSVTQLYRGDGVPGFSPRLVAAVPRAGDSAPSRAELLTLDPTPLGPEVLT